MFRGFMKNTKYVAWCYYGDPREELDCWIVSEKPTTGASGKVIKKFYHDDEQSERAAKELAEKLNAEAA
jgi:hypothetical protein